MSPATLRSLWLRLQEAVEAAAGAADPAGSAAAGAQDAPPPQAAAPGADLPFLAREFAGNALTRWGIAIAVFVLALAGLRLLKNLLLRRVRALAQRTENRLDDLLIELVERTKGFFLVLLAAFIASHSLSLQERTRSIFEQVVTLGVLLQVGFWAGHVVTFAIRSLIERRGHEEPSRRALAGVFGFLARLGVWSIVALLALDNVGVDVTAAVAGLGVGGIAVALALQNILGDLFASLTIILDKPFEIGDFIIVGDVLGTVENIGLKTTRLRSLSGEQIVMGNSDLLTSRIRNFKRMQERRITFSFGVTYQTRPEQLERIPEMIREIFAAVDGARLDRAHFKALGASSLDYEVVYYVSSPDFNEYMNRQQRINLELMRRFAAAGIEFAYPTQTIYLART